MKAKHALPRPRRGLTIHGPGKRRLARASSPVAGCAMAYLFHREGERAFVQAPFHRLKFRNPRPTTGDHLASRATAVSGGVPLGHRQISACTFVVSTSDVSTLA